MAKAAKERGQPVPEVIKNRPSLLPEAIFYFKAYDDLYDCSWVDCKTYAEYYGKRVDDLWRVIMKVRAGMRKGS